MQPAVQPAAGPLRGRRGVHNLFRAPVSDNDPHGPERPFHRRIVERITRYVAVQCKDMVIGNGLVFLVRADMLQHPEIVQHFGLCTPCCHDLPAICKPAYFIKREGLPSMAVDACAARMSCSRRTEISHFGTRWAWRITSRAAAMAASRRTFHGIGKCRDKRRVSFMKAP